MRVFVAIELDEGVRSALADLQAKLGRACQGVRWTAPHLLHLTVRFLGEVPDKDVVDVAEAVAQAAGEARACTFELAECGCFPRRGPVRIVWAGVRDASGLLERCVDRVEAALEDIGYPRERRPFSPHITIGRVREDRSGGRNRAATDAMTFGPLSQPAAAVTLMRSDLAPGGPTYTPLGKTELGGA